MKFEDFLSTLDGTAPPAGIRPLLEALWWDRKGDWDTAHRIAQSVDTEDGSWVHAYLHREEGDQANARYWYSRAGKPPARASLEEEWSRLALHLTGGLRD